MSRPPASAMPARSRPGWTAHRTGDVPVRLARRWNRLACAAAGLAAAGSIAGLLAGHRIYGRETTVLADAASAQDAVNLALVAPLLVVLGVAAVRGSLPAYLAWLGCLAFTVYNYAIYAFSVQFGPLFLLWTTVLGLATFALIGGMATLNIAAVEGRYAGRAMPLTAWLLIAVATLFAALWLSEIIPDLAAGGPSRSATDWNVPTNPVHVLDLTFFLPAVAVSGVLLLRRHPLGYATAAGQLVFLALTCLPVLVTPLIAALRGHDAVWAVMAPVGLVLAVTTMVLTRILRGLTRDRSVSRNSRTRDSAVRGRTLTRRAAGK